MRADEPAHPPRARLVAIGGTDITTLDAGWTVAKLSPGAAKDPSQLAALVRDDEWLPGSAPGTVAGALRDAGTLDWDRALDLDAHDWWFRCRFDAPANADGRRQVLHFDGLATVAEVWLNGASILSSESMWLAHDVDVTARLAPHNDLVIRCVSLTSVLAARRPRPKWRTRVVEQQQLRWHRTTLLGRMPGWTPPVAAVGPWRGIALETRGPVALLDVSLQPRIVGNDGVVAVVIQVAAGEATALAGATVQSGAHSSALKVVRTDAGATLSGTLTIPHAKKWWPHTHGEPALHDLRLSIESGTSTHAAAIGRVGFRDLEVERGADGLGFALRINGEPIFARGACWAPLDAATLNVGAGVSRTALLQARAAGFNMLRIAGTMAYETDAFHDACDELGILVWQDFMFANMDYPADDAHFVSLVRAEVAQLLERHGHRPSLAVLCGGSEVSQQAAMLGLPHEAWSNALFDAILPEQCAALAPGAVYVQNSPSGGALPFHSNEGVSHYYGVGAYLRPLEDARRANVRFTTECLGFANVPEPRTVELVANVTEPAPHHPRWKARVPRDRGAGWDFDDVRDHYFRVIFGLDPLTVRYADVERYLALSRVVSGEVMARTVAEWRRPGSACAGAMVWMHRDLWPGAGWGIVDSTGIPKAAYWFLARACAPVALLATDEGVSGIALHVMNDAPAPIDGELSVSLWRQGVRIAEGSLPSPVPAHSSRTVNADTVIGRFTDVGYAFRFGPPGHDLVIATLRDRVSGATLSEVFHFPVGMPSSVVPSMEVTAEAMPNADGTWSLAVRSSSPAIAVALDIPGFTPSDSYFHIAPESTRTIVLRGDGSVARPAGTVQPLNAAAPTRIVAPS